MDSIAAIKDMVEAAEAHAETQAADRMRATEYYRGEMSDTPSDKGRSSFVSRDVRAHVKKVMPSVMRVIFGSDQVVEFQPIEEGDEEQAEQATDYINNVTIDEAKVEQAVHDATHDALLLRNGLLKWWWDDADEVTFSRHSGLTEDELAMLVADEGVELVEKSENGDEAPDLPMDEMGQPVTLWDAKVKRTRKRGRVRVSALSREKFLLDPDATSIADALIVGEKTEMTRSELVSLGYDKARIWKLPTADGEDVSDNLDESVRANESVDYYDFYIRIDEDEDGISELRHMVYAGGLAETNRLVNDEADEIQYCDVVAMRQPHKWEGISLADDLMDLQRVKTVLMRQTLDNLYWQNNPQPIMIDGAVMNEESVYNPEFGMPIRVDRNKAADIRSALGFNNVPFVAKDSFSMLEYIDSEAEDRTGVSDASSGMAPDALQNVTAKASAMIEQQGIGQTEYLVRSIAESLEPLFRGLLRLTIRHQDKPRTVRLRGEWVEFDPRHWNADMDLSVNTGLGAGTRERDTMLMQQVLMLQEKMLAGFGPDNPFVKPDNVWNALSKLTEASGLKTPRMFFTEPDPEEVQAKMQAAAEAPSPEQQKAEAAMQIEQMKQETQRAKEAAQLEADLTTQKAQIEAESLRQREEFAYKSASEERTLQWEREKFAAEIALKREEMQKRLQQEVWKAQADAIRAEDMAKRDDERWQAEREAKDGEKAA